MNRKTYGFFAVCLLCCLGVFLLYRVPWEAIVYAMLLCLAIGAAVGGIPLSPPETPGYDQGGGAKPPNG